MIGGISFSATSITSGLDVDKPINPRPGHQYLATDTQRQYNCYVTGIWSDNSKVTSGVLSERPINPVVGDIYFTTDTQRQYNCYVTGIWSDNSKVTSGVLSERPINPVVGDIYFTTDTQRQYNCYTAGVWVEAAPPLPKIAIVETASNPDSTSTQIFYRCIGYTGLMNRPNSCGWAPSYSFIIQNDFTAFLQFFTRGYDGTGAGTTTHRMCINGVSAYVYSSDHRDGVANTAVHEFKKGDIVKIIATSTATDINIVAELSIKCIPILNIDGVKFTPASFDQSAFLTMV